MKNNKLLFALGLLAVIMAVTCIAFVLNSHHALVFHPKGLIAKSALAVILTNIFLMLLIILPTYCLLFAVVWKYCLKKEGGHDPEHTAGPLSEPLMWGLPAIVVTVLSVFTWIVTHDLDPYKPIESDVKPLTVQVVALDWKWLFIYPEFGIAALNHFHIPEGTPVMLQLTADSAPMNSFWVPQLSGQIYAMTGMSTTLHWMADHPGTFPGKAVEINGDGYADMTFSVTVEAPEEFGQRVKQAKASSLQLTDEVYEELIKPAINKERAVFSGVEDGFYSKIIDKYMYPTRPVWNTQRIMRTTDIWQMIPKFLVFGSI